MRYQGGKSRIANPIAEIISNICSREREGVGRCFVSLFCGSCSIESKITGFDRKILNDNHQYLIALLNGAKNGYAFPECISEEEYKYAKNHKDEDKALAGFVGFGCSFGGGFFQGYARSKEGRNYAVESKKSLLKDMSALMDAEFICMDYKDVYLPDECVVYADPPYANTKRYENKKFDSEEFWSYMREISKSHLVFISEQVAPDDFVSIWNKRIKRTLDVNKSNQFTVTENLFIHKSWFDKIHGGDENDIK